MGNTERLSQPLSLTAFPTPDAARGGVVLLVEQLRAYLLGSARAESRLQPHSSHTCWSAHLSLHNERQALTTEVPSVDDASGGHLDHTQLTRQHRLDMCFVLLMLLCCYNSCDSLTVRCPPQRWACRSSRRARSPLFNDANFFPRHPHLSHAVNLPLTLVTSCLLNTNQFSVIMPVELAIPQPASSGHPPLYRSPRLELKYSTALMHLRIETCRVGFSISPLGW